MASTVSEANEGTKSVIPCVIPGFLQQNIFQKIMEQEIQAIAGISNHSCCSGWRKQIGTVLMFWILSG